MPIELLNPPGIPAPEFYRQVAVATGTRTVYLAGQIREILAVWIARADVQAVLSNGGTGIAARDTTYDAISGMLEKRIDGFGELFRMLSWQEVGAAAMLSRAVAGVAGGTLIVALPGSTNAVRLALTKLIVPELGHLVYEITK